jgi:type II secretory pathway component PulK
MSARLLRSRRSGFTLLIVLCVIIAVSSLGTSMVRTSSDALFAVTNRLNLLHAGWMAEGCAERARAAIDERLATTESNDTIWRSLDVAVAASPLSSGCRLELVPAGMTLNVNDDELVSDATIRTVLLARGTEESRADSLIDALRDWTDSDDVPRPHGAERSWYERAQLPTPRNGRIAALAELRHVRGFDGIAGLDSILGVDSARIYLARAPLTVLEVLPGIGAEAIREIAESRAIGQPIEDLDALTAKLPSASREALLAHYGDLVVRIANVPDAWIVSASSSYGSPRMTAMLELRLVREGKRAAVTRRRMWP